MLTKVGDQRQKTAREVLNSHNTAVQSRMEKKFIIVE